MQARDESAVKGGRCLGAKVAAKLSSASAESDLPVKSVLQLCRSRCRRLDGCNDR